MDESMDNILLLSISIMSWQNQRLISACPKSLEKISFIFYIDIGALGD